MLKKKPGDVVNLENDVIGKYVERLLGLAKEEKKETAPDCLTMDKLKEFLL